MTQWRVFHAVFEQEGVPTSAQPVQAGRDCDGARVAVIA